MTHQAVVNVLKAHEDNLSDRVEPDRCDKCIGEGVVIVSRDGLTLRFCNHHANRYEASLIAAGWVKS